VAARRIAVREFDWQVIERFLYASRSICSSQIPFSLLVISSLKKEREAERRQTQVTTATSCDAARTLQGALVCRRSTTALT
jgi:hypothetical protein